MYELTGLTKELCSNHTAKILIAKADSAAVEEKIVTATCSLMSLGIVKHES